MALKDLREYIDILEKEGELQRIEEEVDWNLEVGAVIRRSYDLRAPAPLFEKIKGYPKGYRILGGPVGASHKPGRYYARLAISLGLRPDSPTEEIIESYIRRKKLSLKPILVSTGPCKENIQIGNEVDLLKFPAPLLHGGDGGRYIGTWHVVIIKDPDTGWVNWATYRLMIHDRNTMGGLVMPFRHIGILYYQKYEPRGEAMEFAVAIGTEPTTPVISFGKFPEGVNEVDIIGGVRGEPLELVKCETVNLEVPATAEIILEGVINPGERREEGPFAEYTGYTNVGPRAPRPVYHVKAITHRNDPILTTMGVSKNNARVFGPLIISGDILDELRERGLPIKMVYVPPSAVGNMIIVSSKVPYAGFAKTIANTIWSSRSGIHLPYVFVVDEDVDVTNMEEVVWAWATRCHPDRGIFKVPNAPGQPLQPFTSPYEKQHGLSAYCLFDCTWPKEWPKEAVPIRSSLETLWPEGVQQKAKGIWEKYGYIE